jgi:hypothetical protein
MSALGHKLPRRLTGGHVRFAPESGRGTAVTRCPLWARSGHADQSNSWAAHLPKYSLDTALQFPPNPAQPMNFLCLAVVQVRQLGEAAGRAVDVSQWVGRADEVIE